MADGKVTAKNDTSMSVCPPKASISHDEKIGKGCVGTSAYRLNMIASLVSKAKDGNALVGIRPEFPLIVVCDFGPYMAEIMLAPVVQPEY